MSRDFFHTGLQVGRSDIRTMLDGIGPGNHWYVDYRNGSDTNDNDSASSGETSGSKLIIILIIPKPITAGTIHDATLFSGIRVFRVLVREYIQ